MYKYVCICILYEFSYCNIELIYMKIHSEWGCHRKCRNIISFLFQFFDPKMKNADLVHSRKH